jgi:hypothetical protein
MGVIYAGKAASIAIGPTTWKGTDADYDMKGEPVDTTNFLSGGFDEHILGIVGAEWSVSGPYDTGASPLTIGTTYTVTYTVGGSVSFTGTARVLGIKITSKVRGATTAEVKMKTVGTFTPSIT